MLTTYAELVVTGLQTEFWLVFELVKRALRLAGCNSGLIVAHKWALNKDGER